MKVFVYGTLRKGDVNHFHLKQAICLEEHCWTYGELHDTGYGYPVLKKDSSKKVYGELYEVTSSILKKLDLLEDYDPTKTNNLYDRIDQKVYSINNTYQAIVYVAGIQLQLCDHIIESGDWLDYLEKKRG